MGDNNKEIHTEQSDCIAQKAGDLKACCKVESSILNYAKKHPEYFIKMLSLHHSLSKYLLTKYSDNWIWDGDGLLRNTSILWPMELIETFEYKLELERLSFSSILWSEDLLEKYNHNWNWHILSKKYIFPNQGSEELLEKFKDRWIWHFILDNESIPWSIELIEKFEDRWDWGGKEALWGEPFHPWH